MCVTRVSAVSDIWAVCCSCGAVAVESDASESGFISSLKRSLFPSSLWAQGPLNSHPFSSLCSCFVPESFQTRRCRVAVDGTFCGRGARRGRVLQPAAPLGCLRAAEQGCCPSSLRDRSACFVLTQQRGLFCQVQLFGRSPVPPRSCLRLCCPGLPEAPHTRKTWPAPASRFPLPTPRPVEFGAAGQRARLGGEGVSCGDRPAVLGGSLDSDKPNVCQGWHGRWGGRVSPSAPA